MPRPVPFLFCRYQMLVEEEPLDADGQFAALTEIKGQLFPHGPKAAREGVRDILVMRPRRQEIEGESVLTWSMGHRPGMRRKTEYNAENDQLDRSLTNDEHTVFTDFIAVPRLNALAVDDRLSDEYMGASPALSRLRSAFQNIDGGAFQAWLLAAGDVTGVVETLALTEYSYSVRRFNPHTRSELARRLSEAMAAEGIFTNRGVVKPAPGETMTYGEGLIGGTAGLADDGYGVVGFKGITPAGHHAQIKKPQFSTDKNDNIKQQQKDQHLRVLFERDAAEQDLTASIVAELVRFYDRDEPPAVPDEPAGGIAAEA